MTPKDSPSALQHNVEDHDDEQFIKKNIFKGVAALVALFGVMVFVGIYFETHLNELSKFISTHASVWTMMFVVYLIDFFITPFPPDVLLVLATKNEIMSDNVQIALAFGVASTLAGFSAWAAARYFVKPHWFGVRFTDFLKLHHKRINRLGKWMVLLGALTPVPYSLTCWAAGFLKMDFKDFFLVASVRVFRFLLYFWIIQKAQNFGELLQGLFS